MIDLDNLPVITLLVRIGLFILSLIVVRMAIKAHSPWSMITALMAGVGMALTLVFAGAGPAGVIDGVSLRPVTFVLTFASVMLLIASIWTFYEQQNRDTRSGAA